MCAVEGVTDGTDSYDVIGGFTFLLGRGLLSY